MNEAIQLDASWKQRLIPEFESKYMQGLKQFLLAEQAANKTIYPLENEIFAALDLTPFDQVKVVILGQDPYHGPNQAHGLCFSVKPDIKTPPSLVNIYKEIQADLGIARAKHGSLINWANQGVLLLNSVLTVEASMATSHQGQGWEEFTDKIIHLLNDEKDNLVFMLWGSYAQQKAKFVDQSKHLVLKAPHPSPLSAHRGFLGCKHFSKCNEYLEQHGMAPIDWQITDV